MISPNKVYDSTVSYQELHLHLSVETAIIIFVKQDGSIRTMLATRNLETCRLQYGFIGPKLGAKEKGCNVNTGSIAVIDLVLGETRAFKKDRVIQAYMLGEITNAEQLNEAIEYFSEFRQAYESNFKSVDLMEKMMNSDSNGSTSVASADNIMNTESKADIDGAINDMFKL